MSEPRKPLPWDEAVGGASSPYQFELGLDPGTRFDAPPPLPLLEVINSAEFTIERLVLQQLRVRATVPEDDREELIDVLRVAAIFEGNQEVELLRKTVGKPQEHPLDITKCAACWRPIPLGDAVIIDDKAYHRRCVTE